MKLDLLSNRARKVCIKNGLSSLLELKSYYQNEYSFSDLKGIDNDISEELILAINSFSEQDEFHKLSVRARRACRSVNIQNSKDLIKYYKNKGDFKSIKNCGFKTIYELDEFVNIKINQEKNLESSLSKDQKNQKIIADLRFSDSQMIIKKKFDFMLSDEYRYKLLNKCLNLELNKLSVRAKNAFISIIENNENYTKAFFEKTILNQFEFKSMKNVGFKASIELNLLRKNFIDFINLYSSSHLDKFDLFLINLEFNLNTTFDKTEYAFLLSSLKNKDFNLIRFFDTHVLRSNLFNEKEKLLIIRFLNLGVKETLSLEQIAEKTDLTYERVRQINQSFKPKDRLICFDGLLNYTKQTFDILNNEPYKKIDLNNTIHFELLNDLKHNPITLNRIVSLISKDLSVITEGDEIKAVNKGRVSNIKFYKKNRTIKANYIYKNDFFNPETLENIFNDIYEKNCEKIDSHYFYDPLNKYDLSVSQKNFLNKIIFENLGISYLNKGYVLKKNTVIKTSDRIEDILVNKNAPMLAEDIVDELNKSRNSKITSIESVRALILKEPKFIVLRGATETGKSLYALSKWEKSKNILRGTIKQLCKEYLSSKDEPVHLYELSKFIKKHRKTNSKNILSNIKVDPYKEFIFFKSSFIGLKSKKYDKSFIESIKSSKTITMEINKFLKQNVFYHEERLIKRMKKKYNFQSVQIEYSISNSVRSGILFREGGKVFYNLIKEDRIIDQLFDSTNESKVAGFNPYRITLDKKNLIISVKLFKENQGLLKKSFFEFDHFTNSFSDFRCLLTYCTESKNYIAFLWKKEMPYHKINPEIYFDDISEFRIIKIYKTTNVVFFPENQIEKFTSFLKVVLDSEMIFNKLEIEGKSINIEDFKIKNLSELEAISLIVDQIHKKYDLDLNLSKARDIYNRIKFLNN